MNAHGDALRAVALVGPTASGKSALAMQLRREDGGLIICCDSVQVYRGLDIGSAKPTPEEREQVRHALLDCCTLPDRFSAARWARQAAQAIREENARGGVPLIVGGSGFYLRALLQGFAEIPDEAPDVRRQLRQELEANGIEAMYRELQRCDPATASRLRPRDTQRILRALGVFRTTGTPLSAWQQRPPVHPPIACPVFVLECPREALRERIATRFHAMLAAGWLEEVRWLAGFTLDDDHPARRAVGYRQLLEHLAGRCSLEQAVHNGITATRRYAKRQITWFRHQTPQACFAPAPELGQRLKELLRP